MEAEKGVHLVHELATILSSSLVSLEILPGGIEEWAATDVNKRLTPDFPFLYSDGNLGIPKKVLYKLYMTAIALFKSSRSVSELCRVSTSIILLTNPAHQTALNARKRLTEKADLDPEQELRFTEVLFRGSADCAKQSILWDHRRWLFGRVYRELLRAGKRNPTLEWATSADLQRLPDIPPKAVISEFSLIRKACESYPRNYYAWAHWHFVVDVVNTQLSLQHHSSDVYLDILGQELEALSHWVDLHVSDHSAVYHLCSLGRLFHALEPRSAIYNRDILGSNATSTSLVKHALSLITSYPSHESLWIYLRESAILLSVEEKRELVEQIESSQLSQSPLTKRFIAWAFAYGTAGSVEGYLLHLTPKSFALS